MSFNLFLLTSLVSALASASLVAVMLRRWNLPRARFFALFAIFTLLWQALQLAGTVLALDPQTRFTLWRLLLVFSSLSATSLALLILDVCNYKPPKPFVVAMVAVELLYAYFVLASNLLIAGIGDVTTVISPIIFGPWGWAVALVHLLPFLYVIPVLSLSWYRNQVTRRNLLVIIFGVLLPTMTFAVFSFVMPLLGLVSPRLTPLALIGIVSVYYLTTSKWETLRVKTRIRTKVFWSFILSSLLVIFVANVILFYSLPRIFSFYELSHLRREANRYAQGFEGYVIDLTNHVGLYSFPSLESISTSSGSSILMSANLKTMLEEEFTAASKQHESILGISLTDADGKELVKVTSLLGELRSLNIDQLADQGESLAFLAAKNLRPGEVYVSPIHLAKDEIAEGIREPSVPVLEFSLPLYDSQGTFVGALLVKSLALQFLPSGSMLKSNGYGLMVLDPQGFFVHSDRDEEEFGGPLDLNTGINLRTRNPQLADMVLGQTQESFELGGSLYASKPAQISVFDPKNYIIFVVYEESVSLLTTLSELLKIALLVELISLVLIGITARRLANSLAEPIESLTIKIKQIEAGNLDLQVATDEPDEIGDLSRSTEALMTKLREEKASVTRKVEERTSQLSGQIVETEKAQRAMINVLEDLNEEKRASESLASDLKKFQLAVENASDHIIITDPEGFIVYANSAAEKITGFSRREILGTKAGALWGKKMPREFYQKMWHTIKQEKKTFSGRINNHRKNGQDYIAESSISPILDMKGNVTFFVGIERDITKSIDVDRMKTEFISLASHQMRTPLSAMRWFSELLLDGSSGPLNPEQHTYVENINKSNERLIELVNSLLDISRIESGRLTIEPLPTDLGKLVTETLATLDEQIKTKRLQVTVNIPTNLPQISVDPKLVSQVYLNLINNAVKYTNEGGKITVTISETPEFLVSEIADTGVGIPESQIHRVFERFFRGDNVMKTSPGGTGLGLYLAKTIVAASGGGINFETKEGGGSKFWFTLPKSGSIANKGEVRLTGTE